MIERVNMEIILYKSYRSPRPLTCRQHIPMPHRLCGIYNAIFIRRGYTSVAFQLQNLYKCGYNRSCVRVSKAPWSNGRILSTQQMFANENRSYVSFQELLLSYIFVLR